MSDTERNVCTYKKVCRHCNLCEIDDRPDMCVDLECEHYTPCVKCGKNRNVDSKGRCDHCQRKKKEKTVVRTADGGYKEVEDDSPNDPRFAMKGISTVNINEDDSGETSDGYVDITPPGVPPVKYSDAEKDYYRRQWEQYEGFYRDPTAYAVIHQIIILEIELNWTVCYMIGKRGEYQKDLESQRNSIITNLQKLRGQLPEKEANELTDDEKSLAMIYDAYIKERQAREKGGVRRIFTQDAVALAPVLPFQLNLQSLLERSGYRTVEAIEAAEKFADSFSENGIPESPEDIAEFFGFPIREEYAQPVGTTVVIDSEDDIDEEGLE